MDINSERLKRSETYGKLRECVFAHPDREHLFPGVALQDFTWAHATLATRGASSTIDARVRSFTSSCALLCVRVCVRACVRAGCFWPKSIARERGVKEDAW